LRSQRAGVRWHLNTHSNNFSVNIALDTMSKNTLVDRLKNVDKYPAPKAANHNSDADDTEVHPGAAPSTAAGHNPQHDENNQQQAPGKGKLIDLRKESFVWTDKWPEESVFTLLVGAVAFTRQGEFDCKAVVLDLGPYFLLV